MATHEITRSELSKRSGAHGHAHAHSHGRATRSRRRLSIVLALTAVYMLAEAAGGWLTGSLALLADAGHMLTDVAALALALVATVALAISLIEGGRLRAPFLHLLFDVTSAFGTVGFSTGLPPQLSAASKLLLAATMFAGRLGPVTVALALTERRGDARYRLPVEPLRIG